MAEINKKRSDILDAAWALFSTKGFYETKMSEIAERAGVGKGTLYEYFSSKQEIFDSTCIEYMTSAKEHVAEISRQAIPFKEKVMRIFDFKLNVMRNGVASIEVVMNSKNIISEKIVKMIFDTVSDMYKIFNEIVDQGKAEGEIRKDIPSEVISCTLTGASNEYFRLKTFESKDVDKPFNYDEIFDLFFNGLGVK